MQGNDPTNYSFVVPALDLPILNFLPTKHPRPIRLVWINRVTNQPLRPTTIEMLQRTLFRSVRTTSVIKLHNSSGLRADFAEEHQRLEFAAAFERAKGAAHVRNQTSISAIFFNHDDAQRAVLRLCESGINKDAISLLWRHGQYLKTAKDIPAPHSTADVAKAMGLGGVVGALLGVAMLSVPGLGSLIAVGALGTALSVSSIAGATTGGLAKMLTDIDVDGVEASLYEKRILEGQVFMLVNTSIVDERLEAIRNTLRDCNAIFME